MNYGDWRVPARTRWAWGLLTAMALLAFAGLSIAALIAASGSNGYALIVLAIALVAAFVNGRASARIATAALRIDPDEIVVVGPLRTTHVLIRHADGFAAELRPTALGNQPTIVLRSDGFRSTPVWLFTRYTSAGGTEEAITELRATAEELNEALAKAKSAGAPASVTT